MLLSIRATFVLGFSAGLLLLSGCEQQKPAATTPAAPAAPAAQVRYECPMGCAGSQSSKPGKCPVCEMELVKKS
ncbi:heavy metal-binding domain-containing protein [Hymenobacter properus]|uniref:Heavy metal binding domain-containing protein n=1 Tax=Hymenobacter properus TaxID=2791026 RepID=A0A931FKM0_9BACT|nr:heavy metal-binding domain-containing protein [Hymenobacter properus]MBF9141151.1 hypothetical protein [Hymenobacter properus]MBR7719960.1 hypothetical protein [Microvirga sp. SRT04]